MYGLYVDDQLRTTLAVQQTVSDASSTQAELVQDEEGPRQPVAFFTDETYVQVLQNFFWFGTYY